MSHQAYKDPYRCTAESSPRYSLVPDSEADVALFEEADEINHQSSDSQVEAEPDAPEQGTVRDKLLHLLKTKCCEYVVALVILGNAVVIGVETDYPEGRIAWRFLEDAFLIFFVLELTLKVFAHGLWFLNWENDDFEWNLLDAVIVSAGVTEVLVYMVVNSLGAGFATIFRLTRMARVLRILRIFKLFRKLHMLASGMHEAMKATFWVTLLLAAVLYIASIVLKRAIGFMQPGSIGLDMLHGKFGSIGSGMMTLFELSASPDLAEFGQWDVLHHYPALLLFFVFWIIFGSFGMIAMLTGVITESMFEKNQARMEEQHEERLAAQKLITVWCTEQFAKLKLEGRLNEVNEASVVDLKTVLPNFAALCKKHGIDSDGYALAECLDNMDDDMSGSISMSECIHGLLVFAEGTSPCSFIEIKHHLLSNKLTLAKNADNLKNITDTLNKNAAIMKGNADVVKGNSEVLATNADVLRSVLMRLDSLETTMWPVIQEVHLLSKDVHSHLIDGKASRFVSEFEASDGLSNDCEQGVLISRERFLKASKVPKSSAGVGGMEEKLQCVPASCNMGMASCESLAESAANLAAMTTRIDGMLVHFGRLRNQVQQFSAGRIRVNALSHAHHSVEAQASVNMGDQADSDFHAGLAKVIDAARSEVTAISHASAAMERASNLELVQQLQTLLRCQNVQPQQPPPWTACAASFPGSLPNGSNR